MSFSALVDALYHDTLSSSAAFRPELVLCGTIVLILLLRVLRLTAHIDSYYVTLGGAVVALWFAAPWQHLDQIKEALHYVTTADAAYYLDGPQQGRPADGTFPAGTQLARLSHDGSYSQVRSPTGIAAHVETNVLRPSFRQPIFTGMLVYDSFTIYFRVLLMLFLVLFTVLTRLSGIPDREAAPDVYSLVLGATLGMCLMASSNHLMMVFLSVEMASVPSYVLAGMLKGRRQSSEAALKYAVYGAGTAGIMLYGISLLGGVLGSVHIPTMARQLAVLLQGASPEQAVGAGTMMVLSLGALMMMVGLAFKLSAVPFHFWCPDVFEGATAEVNAFLSVASKAAALALLVRVAIGLSYIPGDVLPSNGGAVFSVADTTAVNADAGAAVANDTPQSAHTAPAAQIAALAPVRDFVAKLLAFVAVITCTFGNLAAYGQTNIKRLLAYSTIAHAGYMIMPVAAAVALAGVDPQGAETAIGALTFYIAVYLFMNLGAFAIVAFLRNMLHSEEIDDYAGLLRRSPIVVICFACILFSLIGLPPLAGFSGKFLIFCALVDAKLWTVLVIAGLNTALSLFYYLRVVKVMTIDPEPENRLPVSFSLIPGTYVVALTLPVLFLGIWWDNMTQWAQAAALHLLS